MSDVEIEYGAVLRSVDEFLGRYRDPFTRANREDLAQEAVIETWRRGGTIRDPACAFAFARTIARRLRYQAARRAARAAAARSLDSDQEVRQAADGLAIPRRERAFLVDGRWVDAEWLSEQLGDVLRGLGPINETIIRGYYQGATCRELSELYGLPPAGVKARIYRGRLRIRETFAARAMRAGRIALAGRSRRRTCNGSGGNDR